MKPNFVRKVFSHQIAQVSIMVSTVSSLGLSLIEMPNIDFLSDEDMKELEKLRELHHKLSVHTLHFAHHLRGSKYAEPPR